MDKATRRLAMVKSAQEYLITHGLEQVKIDTLAQAMGVSRAKLYQYFGSKNGVIAAVVQRYLDFVAEAQLPTDVQQPMAFAQSFFDVYFDDVAYLGTATPRLLAGLRAEYPQLYLALSQALQQRVTAERAYLTAGQTAGTFYPDLAVDLVLLQNQRVIPNMLTKEFTLQSQLTLQEILQAYFRQLTRTVVQPQYQDSALASWNAEKIPRVIETYTRLLLQA